MLAALEAEAAKASPGRNTSSSEKWRTSAGMPAAMSRPRSPAEIHDALRAASMETAREQPVNSGAPREQGRAILNASFLVRPRRSSISRRRCTAMVNKYEPSGFKFDFTGPWPPYHFVGEKAE